MASKIRKSQMLCMNGNNALTARKDPTIQNCESVEKRKWIQSAKGVPPSPPPSSENHEISEKGLNRSVNSNCTKYRKSMKMAKKLKPPPIPRTQQGGKKNKLIKLGSSAFRGINNAVF